MICPHCHLEDLGGLHSAEFCVESLAEVLNRVPVTGGMILPRPAVDHDAYRKGLCCSCGEAPYSPGRPRCTPCHDTFVAGWPDMTPQLRPGQPGKCQCGRPTRGGAVRCVSCMTPQPNGRCHTKGCGNPAPGKRLHCLPCGRVSKSTSNKKRKA